MSVYYDTCHATLVATEGIKLFALIQGSETRLHDYLLITT